MKRQPWSIPTSPEKKGSPLKTNHLAKPGDLCQESLFRAVLRFEFEQRKVPNFPLFVQEARLHDFFIDLLAEGQKMAILRVLLGSKGHFV